MNSERTLERWIASDVLRIMGNDLIKVSDRFKLKEIVTKYEGIKTRLTAYNTRSFLIKLNL